jgi:hypothetical protein
MKELVRVEQFIEESSDRHDTAMKLQDFSSIQGDFTNKPTTNNDVADLPTVSYFDTVIL